MSNISTSLTERGQPSTRYQEKAWLPYRNCEMVYLVVFFYTRIQKSTYFFRVGVDLHTSLTCTPANTVRIYYT